MSHAISPTLYAKLPFNPRADFTFVSTMWWFYGSAGAGMTLHLSGELFKTLANVDILHVPYRGAAPAMQYLLAGQIQMMFDNIPGTLAQARAGKVRPIAVTSAKRSSRLVTKPLRRVGDSSDCGNLARLRHRFVDDADGAGEVAARCHRPAFATRADST